MGRCALRGDDQAATWHRAAGMLVFTIVNRARVRPATERERVFNGIVRAPARRATKAEMIAKMRISVQSANVRRLEAPQSGNPSAQVRSHGDIPVEGACVACWLWRGRS